MAKFVKKSLIFLIIALVACVILGFVITMATKDIYKDNYQKGFVYQYRRLQQADADTPKIIVFGGSYLTFSLDTKQLEEQTGVPSYEFGVQSNMGMCYTIELMEDYINEGDIVVFPFQDFAKEDYGMDLIYTSIESEPDMFFGFLKEHPQQLITALPHCVARRVFGLFRNTDDPYYTAKAFDKDYAFYDLDRPEPLLTPEELAAAGYAFTMQDVDPTCLERLNELNALCEAKGAKLLLTYAPICEQSVFSRPELREEYMNALDEALDPEFICRLDDCFYDASLVFNGNMHLNNEGVKAYTSDLAEMLKPYIN